MGETVLGIDVGGSKIAAILVGPDDHIVAQATVATDGRDLPAQILAAANGVLDGMRPAAVGVAVPGQVDPAAGIVRMAVNLSLQEVPLAAALREGLGVPAYVDHDTRAAVAWLLQRGSRPRSLAYLSVGTGISAAVAIEGRILRGVSGLAGEIGHVVAVPNGPPCACGLAGCLEAVAAGPAVERRAGRPPQEVFRAAAGGDADALEVTREVGAHLARAIRGIALVYGVDRIVLGGGLSRAGPPFMAPILEALEREREASALVRQALPAGNVELLAADAEAGAWGGVVIARAGLKVASADPEVRWEVDDG